MHQSLRVSAAALSLATLALATFAAILASVPAAGAQNSVIRINEILASNDSFIADEFGEFEDWVELHNTSGASVDLSAWTLTDDVLSPAKWRFPQGTTIDANGFLIIYASKKDPLPGSSNLHASFSLSASGEYLGLFDDAGQPVDSFDPTYPAQTTDVSYGVSSAGSLTFFAEPSPDAVNSGPGIVSEVTYSVPHGFFDNAFNLSLSSASPNATIRFTVDGSEPTLQNGQTFSSPISIDETSMIRTRAFVSGQSPSTLATQTYVFLADVIAQDSTPPGWPTGDVNGQRLEFGMDSNVVDGNEAAVRAALQAIPTMSLVTDVDNLFDAQTGIYVNAEQDGREWERPGSIELIDPSGADLGFEVNAGIRVRGGFSRRDENPKHAFRLFFRSEYGDTKLDYPLFGADGAQRFEKVDLRTSQNYSWAETGSDQNTLVRELWSRDTQADMGQPHTRSEYYHLYVNGQYFGIFETQERVSKEYAESYFGGDKDDYDVVKSDRDESYATVAADGTLTAWQSMWSLVSDEFITNAEYQAIEAQVDLANLADLYLLHFFSGDFDGAPSWFVERNVVGSSYNRANNWQGIRDRNSGKWRFFDHDSEHSLCIRDGGPDEGVAIDNTGPWLSGADNPAWSAAFFNPGWLHQALLTNDNYVQLFRDRVQLQMLDGGGPLTNAANVARLDERLAELDGAILAQSARWGDGGPDLQGVAEWQAEINFVRNECLPQRQSIVQGQLADDGLMPTLNPPVIANAGATIDFGGTVSMSNPNGGGAIVYTTDGRDPRGLNNTPVVGALSGLSVTVEDYVTVVARVRSGNDWSAPVTATFELASIPTEPAIVLNEYNAVAGDELLGNGASDPVFGRVPGNGGDWFELVVLEDNLDLRGWRFEIIDGETNSATREIFELTTSAVLASIPAGTILTVSENQPDDVAVDPGAGDWSMNLQANDADDGTFITNLSQENFDTNADDWQLIIRDASGSVRALKTGEGAGALTGVGPAEVGKLEATPSTSTTPDSNYDDGTTSTFGLPNRWDMEVQDLSALRGFTNPSVSVTQSCFFDNGRFDIELGNGGTLPAAFVVTLSGLPSRAHMVDGGAMSSERFTGRQDGSYQLTVTADGQTVFDQSYEVECDPEVEIVTTCLQQNGRVDALIINRGASNATYTVKFGTLVRAKDIAASDNGRVTVTGRRDGVLPVTVDRNGVEIFSGSATVDCDPPGPEVATRVSCLSGNGWIRVDLDNDTAMAQVYEVTVGSLAGRSRTVAAKSTATVSVTGRADGDYPVIVERNGTEVFSSTVTVGCDLLPGSEVSVTGGCISGLGRVDIVLFNNSGASATYDVSVAALSRTRTLADDAVTTVTVTGRPNGPLRVNVRRDGAQIFTQQLVIDCGGPQQ